MISDDEKEVDRAGNLPLNKTAKRRSFLHLGTCHTEMKTYKKKWNGSTSLPLSALSATL